MKFLPNSMPVNERLLCVTHCLDGSGSIDAKELENLLNHFFEGSDKQGQVQEFLQVADINKNGSIDWKEFLKVIGSKFVV